MEPHDKNNLAKRSHELEIIIFIMLVSSDSSILQADIIRGAYRFYASKNSLILLGEIRLNVVFG